jgi:hypothetical protein
VIPALNAPFPWFGGKSRAAQLIWERLGNCQNYVEPFAGSLAILLGRPDQPGIETINDKDAFVANVWRALAADPAAVAQWCDWPCSEPDMHARHLWLRERREALTARILGDPGYYDAQIAGWWLWGISLWIGGGWCGKSGGGPWGTTLDEEGHRVFTNMEHTGQGVNGVSRRRIHLGHGGQGVSRQRIHLDWPANGNRALSSAHGLLAWFQALQTRLRHVRVVCGDWQRVMSKTVTWDHGLTGIVLDPPYSTEEGRDMRIYAEDSGTVAHDVRAWCLANGRHPLLRIVLCGYDTVHDALLAQGWTVEEWRSNGGYGNLGQGRGRANKARERLWFSPACMGAEQPRLL